MFDVGREPGNLFHRIWLPSKLDEVPPRAGCSVEVDVVTQLIEPNGMSKIYIEYKTHFQRQTFTYKTEARNVNVLSRPHRYELDPFAQHVSSFNMTNMINMRNRLPLISAGQSSLGRKIFPLPQDPVFSLCGDLVFVGPSYKMRTERFAKPGEVEKSAGSRTSPTTTTLTMDLLQLCIKVLANPIDLYYFQWPSKQFFLVIQILYNCLTIFDTLTAIDQSPKFYVSIYTPGMSKHMCETVKKSYIFQLENQLSLSFIWYSILRKIFKRIFWLSVKVVKSSGFSFSLLLLFVFSFVPVIISCALLSSSLSSILRDFSAYSSVYLSHLGLFFCSFFCLTFPFLVPSIIYIDFLKTFLVFWSNPMNFHVFRPHYQTVILNNNVEFSEMKVLCTVWMRNVTSSISFDRNIRKIRNMMSY